MGYDRFCRTYQRHVLVTGAASRVGHKAGRRRWRSTGRGRRCSWPIRSREGLGGVFVRRMPAFQPVCVRRTRPWTCGRTPGCAPTWRCSQFFARHGPADRAGQSEDRCHQASPRGRSRPQRRLPRDGGALFGGGAAGPCAAPKDKASVENTVSHVATWVIAGSEAASSSPRCRQLRAADHRADRCLQRESRSRSGRVRASVFTAEEKPLLNRVAGGGLRDQHAGPTGAGWAGTGTWSGQKTSTPSRSPISAPRLTCAITDTMIQTYRGHRTADQPPAAARGRRRTSIGRTKPTCPRASTAGKPGTGPGSTTGPYGWDRRAVTVIEKIFESVPRRGAGPGPGTGGAAPLPTLLTARVEAACQLALRGPIRSPGMRTCGRSWPPGRTKPPALEATRDEPTNTADTCAAPNTTQEGPDEPDGYGNQTQAP